MSQSIKGSESTTHRRNRNPLIIDHFEDRLDFSLSIESDQLELDLRIIELFEFPMGDDSTNLILRIRKMGKGIFIATRWFLI